MALIVSQSAMRSSVFSDAQKRLSDAASTTVTTGSDLSKSIDQLPSSASSELDGQIIWPMEVQWSDVKVLSTELDASVTEDAFPGFVGNVAVDDITSTVSKALIHSHSNLGAPCAGIGSNPRRFRLNVVRVTGPVMCESLGKVCALLTRSANGQIKWIGLRETVGLDHAYSKAKRLEATIPTTGSCKLTSPVLSKLTIVRGMWGWTWQHVCQDIIDAVGTLWDDLLQDPKMKILMEPGQPGQHRHREELIDLLGLRDRIVVQNGQCFAANALAFVNKHDRLPGSESRGLHRIRTQLWSRLNCGKDSVRDKVLILQRRSGSRNVANFDALVTRLKPWVEENFGTRLSFEVYQPGDLSLTESLQKMCRCAIAFHVHGGMLFHSLTMPAGSHVVEFIPKTGMCTTGVEFNTALGHHVWEVGANGDRDAVHVEIPMNEFEAVLPQLAAHVKSATWMRSKDQVIEPTTQPRVTPPQPTSSPERFYTPEQWDALSEGEGRGSQNGEDRQLFRSFFRNLRNGTFLEIGALDGWRYSNTYMYEKHYNWRGLLIEANPEDATRCITNRPLAKCVNSAICDTRRVVHFAKVTAAGGILEFMSDVHIKQFIGTQNKGVEVQCMPMMDVLEKATSPPMLHFNLFSLDVEGAEWEILKTVDLKRVTVDVWLIESDGSLPAKEKLIREKLEEFGYQLYTGANFPNSRCFVRKGFKY